ncbi:MAG: flagellar filament capping protein FliD [Sporichthyaceae bacterium]
MVGMSVDGLVSGLDTSSLINQLMSAEAAPQTALKSKVSVQQTVVSAFQGLNTRYASLKAAADILAKPQTWTTATATSSSTAVKASAGPEALAGRLDFEVTALALAHSVATTTFADVNELVPAWPALLTGTKDGAAFSITASTNSAAGLIGAINTATAVNGASLNLQATLIQVAPGTYRIQVTAKDTGAADVFTLNGLGTTTLVRQGTDAKIDLGGGLEVTSATNTFTDVLPGTSFTVSKVESGVSVIAEASPESLADRMAAMVSSANSALSEAARVSAYDPVAKRGGPLTGDSTVRSLTAATLGVTSTVVPDAGAVGDAGLALDRNGKLTFDRAKFLALMATDPERAQALSIGVAGALAATASAATDATSGSLTVAIQGRESTIKDLGTRIESWDQRLTMRKAALQRQFSAMETALSGLKSQSSWLSGQLASLPTWSNS